MKSNKKILITFFSILLISTISIFSTSALDLPSPSPTPPNPELYDIEGHKYEEAIRYIFSLNIKTLPSHSVFSSQKIPS